MNSTIPVDTDWRQSELRETFRRALLPDLQRWMVQTAPTPRYALIDAGQLHLTEVQLVPLLREHALPFEPILRHTPEAALETVGPYLVELDDANPAALEALTGLMEHGWIISVLSSSLPAFKLHTHLRGCLNGLLEDGTAVQLRYYDPRILAVLLRSAPDSIRSPLIGPIDTMAWWDRELHWQALKGQNNQTLRPEQESFVLPNSLVQALGKTGQADLTRSLIVTDEARSDQADALAPHLQYQIIADLVRRARKYGLDTQSSIRLFCSIGLNTCFTFDQAVPAIASALASPPHAESHFAAAVDTMTDADWHAVESLGTQQLDVMRKRFVDDLNSKTAS
ncbi:DUF4123 domain-containing protein [Cupriavidus oxalaticus]|uniref:DUF4123 domain-containing protein n=1 Tax=Cupriavidus oxalaticus TaxID=96344 RepID=UPI003F733918